MAQFDVYLNPIPAARRAYPFVVAMQSDVALSPSEQIVAPLVPLESMPSLPGHLAPTVAVKGEDHVVLVPRLTTIRTRDLAQSVSSAAPARRNLLAAIDYLFFGV
ncbi:MAG: CcdB family protein [Pseudomonadota bacterium]|nr:CcdB family protein [Pseudomonadota bacterium]